MSNLIVTSTREAFEAAKNRSLAVTDKVLSMAIERCTTWDDMDEAETIAFLLALEQQVAAVSVTDPGISTLVSKIDERAEEEITENIDAAMKAKVTAVNVYSIFKRIYTKEEMDAMPYPGTEKEHVGDNAKPDIVKTTDQTGKAITVTWTNDFVSAMARGKALEQSIDDIKKEQKAPGSVPALKGKGKAELASMLSDASGRRNALRSMVKRAIALHHRFEAIKAMPAVSIQWIKGNGTCTVMPDKFGEEKGKPVTGAPKPIWVYPVDDAGSGRDFSVTQLLAFDPAKALNMQEGGTMAELVATAATGSAPPEGETEKTVDDFTNDVVDYSAILNKRENMALLLTKVAPSKDKADTSADDLLVSVCGLYLNLAPVYNKNKSRYEALINKDEDETARKAG